MKTSTSVLLGTGIAIAAGLSSGFLFHSTSDTAIQTIPTSHDNDAAWIQFHKNLLSRFGAKDAASLWTQAYNRIKPSIDTSDLRSYLKTQGIAFSGTTIDAIVDDASAIISSPFTVLSSLFKVGKTVTIIIVITAAGAVFLIIKGIMSHPEVIGTAAKFA